MIVAKHKNYKTTVTGGIKDHEHRFYHAHDGFDLGVDDENHSWEEKQKVFECACGASYIDCDVTTWVDSADEIADEIEAKELREER